MALFSVTVPQKQLVVDFSIKEVQQAIKKLTKVVKCVPMAQNDILKRYEFNFREFLSMGNVLSITLEEISPTKTRITTDITRAVGTFNQAHEVQGAENHYRELIESLSILLSNPEMSDQEMSSSLEERSGSGFLQVLMVIIGGIIILAILAL